ncbi:hypothetical protein AB834_06175 [PVC group bacterium (ex Bugula neritina AB1)]|nr:hypothetical protein AB834_06175 [PVC group bacterium (ex Bugula neritina AB1)]
MKHFILTFLFLSLCPFVEGKEKEDFESYFRKAESFYQDKRFDQAIQQYDLMIRKGYQNASIFYNLGTAFISQSQYSLGIWALEKARQYDAADQSILDNLNFALKKSGLPRRLEVSFLEGWVFKFVQIFSLNIWIFFSLFSYLAFWVVIVFRLANKSSSRMHYFLFLFFSIFLICDFFIAMNVFYLRNPKKGIVVQSSVKLREAPAKKFIGQEVLPEGITCRVLQKSGSWLEVKTSSQLRGWIPKDSLKRL